jgi:hypothetical protein
VFAYRYHATVVETPTQARNAISYIINNWRRHGRDRGSVWRTDPYSSAHAIEGWRVEPHPGRLPVVRASTWLLTEGYKRAAPIREDDVPGPDPEP